MAIAYLILLIVAFVMFICSAVVYPSGAAPRWNLMAVGFALWVLAEIARTVGAR